MPENGFLTERDRKFLRGEKEYTGENAKQMRYQVRRAIRERTRAAFRDFSLLYAALDENERKKIFKISDDPIFDTAAEEDIGISRETRDGITDTLAFLYLSLTGEVGDGAYPPATPGVPDFEGALDRAISQAEADRRADHDGVGPFTDTDLTVEVFEADSVDISAAAEKLARGDTWRLSEAELRALVQTAYDNTNDYALEPLIDEKRKELGMDPDEIRADVQWFEDTYIHDAVDDTDGGDSDDAGDDG